MAYLSGEQAFLQILTQEGVSVMFHTHSAPGVFGRAVDDEELASLASARQMEAVVFKSHIALTADRAWRARKHVLGALLMG